MEVGEQEGTWTSPIKILRSLDRRREKGEERKRGAGKKGGKGVELVIDGDTLESFSYVLGHLLKRPLPREITMCAEVWIVKSANICRVGSWMLLWEQ